MDKQHLYLAGCIITDSQKRILLLHRKTPKRTHWELPGGKVNPDEHPEKCAIREIKEELGIDVKILKKRGSTTFEEDAIQMHYDWFDAEITKGEPELKESMFDELRYISWKELKEKNIILSNNLKNLIKLH